MANPEAVIQQPIVIPGLGPVREAITGFWLSQAIYVAAKLGIADLVEEGPKTSEELARAAGANAFALHRVLRALASVGRNTPRRSFATCLRAPVSDSPGLYQLPDCNA
jgi:hypothetical protein